MRTSTSAFTAHGRRKAGWLWWRGGSPLTPVDWSSWTRSPSSGTAPTVAACASRLRRCGESEASGRRSRRGSIASPPHAKGRCRRPVRRGVRHTGHHGRGRLKLRAGTTPGGGHCVALHHGARHRGAIRDRHGNASVVWTSRYPRAVLPGSRSPPPRVTECAQWAREFLGDYSWPDEELILAAKKEGFNEVNVKRAKALMRKEEPPLCCKPRSAGEKWWNWIGEKSSQNQERPLDKVVASPHGRELSLQRVDSTPEVLPTLSLGRDGRD